ncbi:MAG: hypothetical protein EBU66_16670 [Bacteroidetes bacterium]|nr:hypothetical protein [bacterium]NBP66271.1 hypothetical protein [Bacteroidota bacterium]
MYHITSYTKQRAKEMGVEVRPSTRKNKKIDVYKDGKYLDSIGDIAYGDYPTFIKEQGKAYADERRRLYHLRHTKNTLGEKLAKFLLW